MESADVFLWGVRSGSVSRRDGAPCVDFEYSPELYGSGIEPSPLMMPVGRKVFPFPNCRNGPFTDFPDFFRIPFRTSSVTRSLTCGSGDRSASPAVFRRLSACAIRLRAAWVRLNIGLRCWKVAMRRRRFASRCSRSWRMMSSRRVAKHEQNLSQT